MITAELIQRCAHLNSMELQSLVSNKERIVLNAKFVGITNGREFCYNYQYSNADTKTGLGQDKVFVRVNDRNQLEAV